MVPWFLVSEEPGERERITGSAHELGVITRVDTKVPHSEPPGRRGRPRETRLIDRVNVMDDAVLIGPLIAQRIDPRGVGGLID